MKKWERPEVSCLYLTSTELEVETFKKKKCSQCCHPITHPDDFGSVSNHTGWCPVVGGNGHPGDKPSFCS